MNDARMIVCAEEYDLSNTTSQYKHITNFIVNEQSPSFNPDNNTYGMNEIGDIIDGIYGKDTFRGIIWKRIEAVTMLGMKANRDTM